MKINSHFSAFVLIITTVFLLGGCWDRREVESLAFITATGIDPVTRSDESTGNWSEIELSARIVNTIGTESGGGSGGEKNLPSTVLTGRGSTPWNALLDIQKSLGWTTFIAHNRVLVVSSDIPKDGQLRHIMDFFDRSRETRRSTLFVIADGLTAHEVLSGFSPLTGPGRSSLYDLIQTNHQLRGTPLITINDFIVLASLEGIDPIAGRISAARQAGDHQHTPAQVIGLSLFQGDRLVGFLEEDAAQGLLWARNKVTVGFINVPCPGHPDLTFLFDIQRLSGSVTTKTKPQLRGKISIVMEGRLGEAECPSRGYRTTTEVIDQAHRTLKTLVEQRIQSAVAQSQKLQSDPFGFGAALMRRDYALWKQVRSRWHDTVWPELPVDLDVQVDIRRTSIVNVPYQISR